LVGPAHTGRVDYLRCYCDFYGHIHLYVFPTLQGAAMTRLKDLTPTAAVLGTRRTAQVTAVSV
jgi:hypothetical protein